MVGKQEVIRFLTAVPLEGFPSVTSRRPTDTGQTAMKNSVPTEIIEIRMEREARASPV